MPASMPDTKAYFFRTIIPLFAVIWTKNCPIESFMIANHYRKVVTN